MKTSIVVTLVVLLTGIRAISTFSQTASTSDFLKTQPSSDRTVLFDISDSGKHLPIIWGLDLAWLSESNVRRGIAFMGEERVDIIRSSFTPTAPLVNGDLQALEMGRLNERLAIIDLLGPHTQIVLNCDHPSVDPWFDGNAANWAQLIDVTVRHHQERGRTVVSVSPFNEPDYGWGQGTIQDFYNIAGLLRQNPRFNNIRICGGNTLSCDAALEWYNGLKDRLDEGNTHQLAGSFNSYATFHQTVQANGDHGTNDELHNVMEAIVGVQYGMQTGIWWGTAELARGEFVKASDGVRLGYAEHRPYWTAAAVYKTLEGKVQAFCGASEREATTTTYRYISKDRDVYFDGQGPQREFTLVMPGGNGYQVNQPNAERVINITWGDDIQPVINGRYVLVNRNSGKVMEVANASTDAGANIQQGTNTGNTYQQWNVTPVDSRIVGDFSYFTFTAAHSGKSPDILDWSLENGANILAWNDTKGGNQQWYLDYVEEGWFYIRSRHNAKCIEVTSASTSNGANIQQWDVNGGTHQQWRFLPVGAPIEFDAPAAPTNLTAIAREESVLLNWTASTSNDVSGYSILRSETQSGPYNTIARNIAGTAFVDNSTTTTGDYYYIVKAVDNSLNRSENSNEASAHTTGHKALLVHLPFDGNLQDNTNNLNHAASTGSINYSQGKIGNNALICNGTDVFLQLPATIAHQEEITIATWVNWDGGAMWQRIFDFGNGEDYNMFLTPSSDNDQLRFAIKNGGEEQRLNSTELPVGVWTHVAVSLGSGKVSMYVNGSLVDESTSFTIHPLDIMPVVNYIGRSQYPDPLFDGSIDDFMIYNFALSADEVSQVYTSGALSIETDCNGENGGSAYIDECGICVGGSTGKQACVTQTIELTQGWNLISLNLENEDMSIETIFPHASTVKTMSSYFESNQAPFLNTLTTLETGTGYLVHNTTTESISVSGTVIQNPALSVETTNSNWQLIGCPWQSSILIENAFNSMLPNIQTIKNFDGYWEQNGVKSIQSLEPGKGYFVR